MRWSSHPWFQRGCLASARAHHGSTRARRKYAQRSISFVHTLREARHELAATRWEWVKASAKISRPSRTTSSERPEIRIEKRPSLRLKQGAFALVSEHGLVLKRGQELHGILAPIERRLMRLVEE